MEYGFFLLYKGNLKTILYFPLNKHILQNHKLHRLNIKHKKTYYYQTVENAIIYDSTFYNLDNVYLSGYWQSEKYFSKSKDAIRKTYTFPQLTGTENLLAKDDILKSNSVSLHVRRGDYLKSKDLGGVCTTEYYKKAIDYISMKIDNPKFFIFSDDILWCENNLEVEDARYINFNKGKDSYQDMHLMSLCKHNIIANSSFSWWGAWLNSNKNKIVISPKIWFKNRNISTNDLLLEEWIKF